MPLLLPLLLVQSGFFPAFLLLYKMTSSVPDAASVWHLRSGLKPHYRDGLVDLLLLGVAADVTAEHRWRELGASSREEARGFIIGALRRR